MIHNRTAIRKSLFARPRVERLEDRTMLSGLGLQSGDLVAGVQRIVDGVLVSQIELVRNGTATPISAPFTTYAEPVEVTADSLGRVVFLGANPFLLNWGLYRLDTLGAAPVLLGAFPSNDAFSGPMPFPGEYFAILSGLHLEESTAITIVGQGSPQVVTGEVYAFAARTFVPSTGQLTGLQSIRYHADSGVWDLNGPQVIDGAIMPDMASGNGYVYSVLDNTLRRSKIPLEVAVSGSVLGVPSSAQLSLFGGYQQLQNITVNDIGIPGTPTGCPPPSDPEVNTLYPGIGGAFTVPMSGFQNVVYDSYGGLGLMITDDYAPIAFASGPVMANVSEKLLDKPDDMSQYYQGFGCAAVPELNFDGVMPYTNPQSGFPNGIINNGIMNGAQMASSPQGVVGVAQGQLWLIAPGNGLQAITSNIGAISVGAYPPAGGSSVANLTKSLLFAIDSPVNVLITDPQGRRLGVDPGSGQFVNDFGIDGFDSGPGEPRFYGIDHPLPGDYSVQAVGTGDGSFGFNVYSIDRNQPVGQHIQVTGTTTVGQSTNPNFGFAADGTIQFDNAGSTTTAPTLAVTDAGGAYNTQPFPASATATDANNAAVTGVFAFSYYAGSTASGTGSPDAPTNAGTYTVVASFTSSDPNYTNAQSGPVTFTISQASPLITVSDAGGFYSGQPFPASATAQKPTCGCPVSGTFAFSYADSQGNVSSNPPANAGAYTVVALFTSADPNYGNAQNGPLAFRILAPASFSGVVFEDFNDDGLVDFGEHGIAAVPITLAGTDDLGHTVNQSSTTEAGGAYMFLNLRPGSYAIIETQPAGYLQGIDSVGTAGGSLAATDRFFVQLGEGINGINYNYGEQPAAGGPIQKGQTAGIGFWNNKNGQALIKALNGGSTSTQLGNWLAATLPNILGSSAGSNNLIGKSNAAVAALFQNDFLLKAVKLDAQVLATALSVYVTNATLDSTQVAAQYGFTVLGDGVGTATVNVGSDGDAFGVADNSTMTVLDLLLATNDQAVGGWLYNGATARRNHANSVYSALNQAGNIA
jgi:hypothetical protein